LGMLSEACLACDWVVTVGLPYRAAAKQGAFETCVCVVGPNWQPCQERWLFAWGPTSPEIGSVRLAETGLAFRQLPVTKVKESRRALNMSRAAHEAKPLLLMASPVKDIIVCRNLSLLKVGK
jgi:hypothetical protein